MVDICVGCSQCKPDSHWIQCTSESGLMWWHTVCAGKGATRGGGAKGAEAPPLACQIQ